MTNFLLGVATGVFAMLVGFYFAFNAGADHEQKLQGWENNDGK